jgi:hypothetical protein
MKKMTMAAVAVLLITSNILVKPQIKLLIQAL